MPPSHFTTIVATSATLSTHVLNNVKDMLQLRTHNFEIYCQSIDWPNINIVVCPIASPFHSFEDLKFIFHDWKPGTTPPKFLVFFNNINHVIAACCELCKCLPLKHQDKL